MIYGYARISTIGKVKGNSLEEQESVLKENGSTIIYKDSFTGTIVTRPEFTKLLDALSGGDTLVVTKLNRFAPNTIDGITIVQQLLEKGVNVNILI